MDIVRIVIFAVLAATAVGFWLLAVWHTLDAAAIRLGAGQPFFRVRRPCSRCVPTSTSSSSR